jgi:chorismate mutase
MMPVSQEEPGAVPPNAAPGVGKILRAARGATTVERDDREEILAATEEVLSAILARNDADVEDVVSVFFTATEDLRSVFPAEAARRMGMSMVPLLCAREMAVEGALGCTVRVLLHFYTDRAAAEVQHAYLRGAHVLREDIA